MTVPAQLQEQQALLQQLTISGDATNLQQAEQLQRLYHDRQMAALSDDVYDAAKGQGQPPPGWTRASDGFDKLRAYATQLGLSDKALGDLLKPDDSGFRAEIYLPDPAVLGPGYKPVVVFKGSRGEVLTADGLRDTTMEDFLANNFPQSAGLKTDYYDRAMFLAKELNDRSLDFELAGHSLGAGMASAAAAVTGMKATTYNAAGLHPRTAQRFAEENGLPVYDVSNRVIAYQVQGDVLTDGVQENIARLDVLRRMQLAGVLKETSQMLHDLPEGAALLKRQLDKSVPSHAQASVHAFVDVLAEGDTTRLLRELPLAAGQVQPPLAAMTERDGRIVAREHAMSLQEVTALAGPVLTTLHVASVGADAGRRMGEGVASGGRIAGQALDGSGDVVRTAGDLGGLVSSKISQAETAAVSAGTAYAGRVAAGAREVAGGLEAGVDLAQGEVQRRGASAGASLLRGVGSLLPEGAQTWMEAKADDLQQVGEEAQRRNLGEAAEAARRSDAEAAALREASRAATAEAARAMAAVGDGRRDVIAGTGQWADRTLDATGEAVQSVSARAPVLGAVHGGVSAATGASALQFSPATPAYSLNMVRTAALFQQAGPSGAEAVERHLMTETVIPSLDARIEAVESEARQRLRQQFAPDRIPHVTPEIDRTSPDRIAPQREDAALLPFSDQRHHQHTLYTDVQTRFPDLSEARLHQVTAEMHKIGMQLGRNSDAIKRNGIVWGSRSDVPGLRFGIDLSSPEPSVQQTMQDVRQHDVEQQRIAQYRQEEMSRGQSGPVMG